MTQTTAEPMQVISDPQEIRAAVVDARDAGNSIGFVPTMGALHAGHLSLVDAALATCETVVVSIFVNPMQFGAGEDLEQYPQPIDEDLKQLSDRGVAFAFVPSRDAMYPDGFETTIDVGRVAVPWEGDTRPGHFAGVATVVAKLLNMVPADEAYFGQKDYQQSLVVKKLVADLNLPVRLRICPTVREPDGLALSSRNAYLSPNEREQATLLWHALLKADTLQATGETCATQLREAMLAVLSAGDNLQVEYATIVEWGTVRELQAVDCPAVAIVAARVGETRLIDNHTIA